MIVHAYDIRILHRTAHRGRGGCDGWCFGSPPGITPAQWPLDPISGYPLMHGFTIRLPEDYRCHGPEIVGLSFFATAPDHNDGGPGEAPPELYDAVIGQGDRPRDPALAALHAGARSAHPRLHRMQDALGCEYALILLTRKELEGRFCSPPQPRESAPLRRKAPPAWIASGALAYFESPAAPTVYLERVFGGRPGPGHAWNRELKITPRRRDPNAGKAPMQGLWDPAPSGYSPYFYRTDDLASTESYRVHEWAEDHEQNHIGGTMRPMQSIPSLSPYYIGFEEYLGGYNFGGGNAQLDFRDMKLEWDCG
jgi:hypothetical protein